MTNNKNTAYLRLHGKNLISNGYNIIPIPNGSKAPSLSNWQNITATNEHLKKWLANGHENSGVGILTKHNPSIDIDVSDERLHKLINDVVTNALGETPQRVGRAPRSLLMYRTDQPFTKMKTGKYKDEWGDTHELEILGEGQQFVAYALHKDTGQPYEWITDNNPINTPSSDLPVITKADAEKIIERAKSTFVNAGLIPVIEIDKPNKATNNALSDDVFAEDESKVDLPIDELRKRLMMIPGAKDHDRWVLIGMALFHQFDGDDDGLALWHEWSESADNYDGEALDKRYKSFAIDGKKRAPVTARSIIKLAKENGLTPARKNVNDNAIVQLLSADHITIEKTNWLWKYYLAQGKLILLAGSPGTGKTTLTMAFASIVSNAGKWPDGVSCNAQGNVIIWSGEDDPSDTLAPRLLAHNAKMQNIRFVSDVIDTDGNKRAFDPSTDSKKLLDAIKQLGNVKLIIIDPIVSAVAGDSHKNAEVRRGLQPIVDLTRELGAVLIGITHFTKGTSGKDTTERVTGSLAFAALARIVLATAKDDENDGYILTRSKSNIGPDGGGFRYKLEQVDLTNYEGVETSKVSWGETLEGNARDLIGQAEGDGKVINNSSIAADWLRRFLADGPRLANDIRDHGKLAGFTESKLKTAKKNIGAFSEKRGLRKDQKNWWLISGQKIPDDYDEGNVFDDDLL